MSALTYDKPPFPLLCANEFAWEGKIMLPAWQGFQSRQGFYCHRDSSVPTDGLLKLRVAAEADDPLSSTPSVEQANALTYLVDCQQEIRNVVLSAFYSKYPQWYLDFADACDEEQLDDLPSKLNAPEDLKNLIGPGIVHLCITNRDGLGYVGIEFGCEWEEEHGLGVMLHKQRIVQIGHADASFLEWVAKRDCSG